MRKRARGRPWSRAKLIRSTPTRRKDAPGEAQRCATSNRRSPTPVGSRCATAGSTAPLTTPLIEPVRKRQFPIVGDGGGFFSFVHLDDAAAATVLALDHDGPAIYNIVDDEPAPGPGMATRDGRGARSQAAPPRPGLACPGAGPASSAWMMGTEARGASNAKAKRELGWTLTLPELAARVRRGVRKGAFRRRPSTAPNQGRTHNPLRRETHESHRRSVLREVRTWLSA